MWVARQPPWRQRLYAACCASEQLSDEELERFLDQALQAQDNAPLDLPVPARAALEPTRQVQLDALRPSGVNALLDDQELRFGADGITLVHGLNGAGKSGYGRQLKWAGRSGSAEAVRGHVVDGGTPSAELDLLVDGQARTELLDFAGARRAGAPLLHAFDSSAVSGLIAGEREVDYVPASVRGLERLAVACGELSRRLQARIDAHPIPAAPDGAVAPATGAGRALAGLHASTDLEALATGARLTEPEQARREKLTRDLAEVASSRAGELRAAAERSRAALRALWRELEVMSSALGTDALGRALADQHEEATAADAADAAARALDGMPLDGVGSDAWRLMWDAAKDFGRHVSGCALPDPSGDGEERCPVCMQQLDGAAVERLQRMETFVLDDVNRRLEAVRRRRADRLAALPDVDSMAARHSVALALLAERGADKELDGWLHSARELVEAIGERRLQEGTEALSCPPDVVREVGVACAREAEAHAALQQLDTQRALRDELDELDARAGLTEHLATVTAAVEAHQHIARLREALPQFATGAINSQQTKVMRQLVQGDLHGHLQAHLRALGFHGMTVRCHNRTVRGRPHVRLVLERAEGTRPDEVLSSGEQRRLALAMFLAEVEVLDLPLPVVFDDPVCSVDQEGRRHIASVLVALAERRQVVVLTHELSFCMALVQQAKRQRVAVTAHHLTRVAGRPGLLRDELPWGGLRAGQRVEALYAQISALRELEQAGDPDARAQAVSHFCNCLRQAFERCVRGGDHRRRRLTGRRGGTHRQRAEHQRQQRGADARQGRHGRQLGLAA